MEAPPKKLADDNMITRCLPTSLYPTTTTTTTTTNTALFHHMLPSHGIAPYYTRSPAQEDNKQQNSRMDNLVGAL